MTLRRTLIHNTLPIFFGFATILATELHASCNATVNGKPMPWVECEAACQIYGSYPYGDYLRDRKGNWVNINNPSERGNIYVDAQYSRGCGGSGGGSSSGGHWSDGDGCISSEWFGGTCIW